MYSYVLYYNIEKPGFYVVSAYLLLNVHLAVPITVNRLMYSAVP